MTETQGRELAEMMVTMGLMDHLMVHSWRWELSVNPHKITGATVQDYVRSGGHVDPDLVYPNYTFRTDNAETVFKISMIPEQGAWRVTFIDVTLVGVLKQATIFLDTGERRA